MGAIAAVLFDLDDTLLDAECAWRLGDGHLPAERDVAGAEAEAQAIPPPHLQGRFTTITTLAAAPGLAGAGLA